MRNLLLFTILLLFTFCNNSELTAQNVVIPDSIFKAYLVGNTAINTNGDTAIQVSEASAFAGQINCNNLGITDLTGIEAFTALTVLRCHYNSLSILNLTQNTALTILLCHNNQLTTLNTSQNTVLATLHCHYNSLSTINVTNNTTLNQFFCSYNQLTTLDVSQNTSLNWLACDNNQLTTLNLTQNTALVTLSCIANQLASIDVSQNTVLTSLSCYNNQLTSLNVANGNNTNFTTFNAISNPNLTCIQVDDAAWSTTNWTSIDATSSFSTNCNLSFTQIAGKLPNIKAYPNPTAGQLSLPLGKNYNNINVEVSNIMGRLIFSKNYSGVQNVNLELDGGAGVYFVKVKTEEGEAIIKVLKE